MRERENSKSQNITLFLFFLRGRTCCKCEREIETGRRRTAILTFIFFLSASGDIQGLRWGALPFSWLCDWAWLRVWSLLLWLSVYDSTIFSDCQPVWAAYTLSLLFSCLPSWNIMAQSKVNIQHLVLTNTTSVSISLFNTFTILAVTLFFR